MNIGFPFHVPEDALEKCALGRLPDADCTPLDEHLLICSICQAHLEEIDEYVRVMQAALGAQFTTLPERHADAYTRGNTDKPSKGKG